MPFYLERGGGAGEERETERGRRELGTQCCNGQLRELGVGTLLFTVHG